MRYCIACAAILTAASSAAADIIVDDQVEEGIFETSGASEQAHTISFDFSAGVELSAIDLVDIDENDAAVLTLVDESALEGGCQVEATLTRDSAAVGPDGGDTLDLTIFEPQIGAHRGIQSASEMLGFDPARVVRVEVHVADSTGPDHLTFIPAPSTAFLTVMGAMALARRRR